MSLQAVGHHLRDTAKTIRGALNPLVWQTIAALYAAQQQDGYEGPVAEIGVHHGKFFISLLHVASVKTPSFAFDLFDLQESNTDRSGRGDLDILKNNILQSGFGLDIVRFVRGDSLLLSSADCGDIVRETQRFAFFSVDGGHTVEHTINDLRLAMLMTSPNGIIALDDYYNPNWPGVQEGTARMFTLDSPTFVPVVYSANKLFFCHVSKHAHYMRSAENYIQRHFPQSRLKRVRRFGYDGLTVMPSASDPDPRSWFTDAA